MKLSFRDQLIVAVIGIVLIAVAFVVLLIAPQFSRLGQLDNDMSAAATKISEAQGLLARRQEAKAQAADTQSRILHLDNQLPDAPELPALIIEMQQMATDSGLQLDEFAPEKPVEVDGYSKIDVQFSVVGEWEDLLDYLRRVQSLQRGVRVLSLTIQPGSTSQDFVGSTPVSQTASTLTQITDPKKISASVRIEAYTMDPQKADAAAGSAAAPAPTSGHE